MKSEILFLKYAFPCSFVLLARKEITKKEHELLYKSTKEEKLYIPAEKIENIFWRAIGFVGSIKNMQAIRKFWRFDHNKILRLVKVNVPEEKLLECMVIPCEVLSVNKDMAIVKSKFDDYINLKVDFVKVKPGKKVTKHYDYACEKISESLYSKMMKNLEKNIGVGK
jgi:hydrogenase maturation factor